MAHKLKVRKARERDIRAITKLMHKPEVYTFIGKDYTEKNLRKWLNDSTNLCLVAETEGQLVGVTLSYPFGFGEEYFGHIRVFDLAVDPKHRRYGIGRSLCLELFKSLKRAKVRKVIGFVNMENSPTQKFNKSIGMKYEGKVDGLFLGRSKLKDGKLYGKFL